MYLSLLIIFHYRNIFTTILHMEIHILYAKKKNIVKLTHKAIIFIYHI